MFIKVVRKPYAWDCLSGRMVINTEHIIAVEASSKDGTAIVTCTGKNREDEVLYYFLEDSYESVVERIMD